MKNKMTLLCAYGFFLAVISPLSATEIAGVKLVAHRTVEGQRLDLNGAGLRTFTLAFIPINIYVAAFYAPTPLRTAKAVEASVGPLRFDFTFLRDVGQGQVIQAWQGQFKSSVGASPYRGYAADEARFVKMFGPLKKMGVETVILSGDQTIVIDQGTPKGQIAGRNFQQAFLRLWFGPNPAMPSLKNELLGH